MFNSVCRCWDEHWMLARLIRDLMTLSLDDEGAQELLRA